jgi:DNA repair protein RecN (Recombination protein N)
MLQYLRIKNFVLIDEVELSFNNGFTILTGETGSGKSILLNAIELLLGERSNTSVIGSLGDKAIVEAVFSIEMIDFQSFFEKHELDKDAETIIRREIAKNGKSRAFINDSPVSLNVLRELSANLVNIHSQYNTLELKSKRFQLEILDNLAGLNEELKIYSSLYLEYAGKQRDLEIKNLRHQELTQKKDYNQYQLDELNALKLDKINFEELLITLNRHENSESILKALQNAEGILDGENAVLHQLSLLKNALSKWTSADVEISGFENRIEVVIIELKDMLIDIQNYAENIEIDPKKIQEYLLLLDTFQSCLRKHNVMNQSQLIDKMNDFSNQVFDLDNVTNEIVVLLGELEVLKLKLQKISSHLHQSRIYAAELIRSQVKEVLSELKLPETELNFNLWESDELTETGSTQVELLFSANKGVAAVPIEKAASGGELSRVMLALQHLISHKKQLPTMLFDEIDTGVSGEVAQKMGELLKKMSANVQLIAISHLPQVAAKASHHWRVKKFTTEMNTLISVEVLDYEQRTEEIARLMSGENITNAALENAKLLML